MTTETDKANILIVDDRPEKLLVYQTILEELAQNLVPVSSGQDALRQVLQHDFAVILLDVNMPDMDGFETARLIRQRKRSAHTPIIFLTAFADEVRTAQGYATGAVDYIPVPVMPEILRAKVRVFVELYRLRQQMAFQAEEQAKRAAAEEAARRSSFLSEASRALASSLDLEATLHTLAQLPLPYLADVCLVALADEHARIYRVECSAHDPARGIIAVPLGDCSLIESTFRTTLMGVATSGEFELLRDLDPAMPLAAGDGSCAAEVRVFALLALPLIARGRTLGAVALGLMAAKRRFLEADISLAEDLAARAAVAIDNAMLVRDIQEADKRKNEFLAMLAHELRNPLAPVRNAIHVMHMKGTQPAELAWARDVIDRQVTHLVRLVDDLLDVSRITRGKIQLNRESVLAADLVHRAVETSRPLIEAHGHTLKLELPEEPLRVKADPTRLAQVLSNLLNNAAKYTPDGGSIHVSVERGGDEAVFRVRDTGAGIPREMLGRIFDLFTQVERSIDRSQGGLGIGLTLVRRLVEMHDGSVQALSDGPGKGSEFTIRLPLHEDAFADGVPEKTPLPAEPAVRAPQRILVVDDNVDAADSLATILRLYGHDVRLAHDGPTALDRASAFRPEVVLLDIGLPGINGYEVARRLRKQPAHRDVLLVAISGYGQEEDRHRSFQAGFDHHLIKPISFETLQSVLPSLVQKGSPSPNGARHASA